MVTTYDQSTVNYDQSTLTYQGLPAQFDGISFAVEMAFGYEPLDDDPSWESVTPYVRGFTVNRGRSSEFSTYGPGTVSIALDNRDRRFDPEHTTGPYYGDLNPMVPVRVQATYSGTTYTMFYGFVTGWPTVYNQSNTDAVATVTAVDATRLLANRLLDQSAYEAQVKQSNPYLYFPMQSIYGYRVDYLSQDVTATDDFFGAGRAISLRTTALQTKQYAYPVGSETGLDRGFTYYRSALYGNPTSAAPNVKYLEAWLDGTPSSTWTSSTTHEFRLIHQRISGTDEFLDLTFEYNIAGVTWQRTSMQYRAESPGVVASNAGTPSVSLNQGMNHIVLTVDGSNLNLYINGVLIETASITSYGGPWGASDDRSDIEVPFGTYASNFVVGTNELSATDVLERYNAGLGYGGELSSARLSRVLDDAAWPSAWRDIETGVQPVGAYRPESLPASRYFPQVDGAEQGSLFVNREGDVEFRSRTTAEGTSIVGLFDDGGVDLPFANVSVDAHTVDAIRNNIVVNYANGSVTSTDAGSVAAYGQATETIDAKLIDDPAVAQSIGDSRLTRTKDPRTRVNRLDVNVRTDPANTVPVVAALDLSDDVTVSLTPTGVGDPLWRAVRVQGIQHTVTPDRWDVSLYLAPGPVNTNGPLLVLDDDTYGELDNNKLG